MALIRANNGSGSGGANKVAKGTFTATSGTQILSSADGLDFEPDIFTYVDNVNVINSWANPNTFGFSGSYSGAWWSAKSTSHNQWNNISWNGSQLSFSVANGRNYTWIACKYE